MTRMNARDGWRPKACAGMAWALVMVGWAAGAAQESAKPEQKTPDEIKAEEMFTRVCIKCHTADRVVGTRRSRSQWEETIVTMQTARGAVITDEEFETVLSYLVKEHGRVNVNRGTTDDIVEVLGIPSAAADSIVKYRRDNGPFADFDALAKVPGLDLEKLEKKRDAITF
jgi:competence ComEA-like helix-hairpin-helix protein